MQHINGDKFLCLGTAKEVAKYLNVKERTVMFYTTPAYLKRVASWKNTKGYSNSIIVIRIED